MLRIQHFAAALAAAILLLSASLLKAEPTSKVYLPVVMMSLPPNLTETTSCFSDVNLAAPPPPEHAPSMGRTDIWVSAGDLRRLPRSGDAWNIVRAVARETPVSNIADLGNQADIVALANAYLYAATGDEAARSKAKSLVLKAVGTEAGGCTLALGRNVLGYVLAADIIGLRTMPEGRNFANWLAAVRTKELDGRTLVSTHNDRPNNWGTHAGASRVAIAAYLGDMNDVEAAARVFQGYLGNRDIHAGFVYGDDLSWQADPGRPAGVNPPGATINGYNVDGVLPDDQRRAGGFTWPPPKENYTWEALQGAVVQAELLARLGYPAWEWQDRALLRAVTWLYEQAGFPAIGDDSWIIPLVNRAYGTSFKANGNPATSVGKNMAFTAWTSPGPAPPEEPASRAANRMPVEAGTPVAAPSDVPSGTARPTLDNVHSKELIYESHGYLGIAQEHLYGLAGG